LKKAYKTKNKADQQYDSWEYAELREKVERI
jgi:hypothetical protein